MKLAIQLVIFAILLPLLLVGASWFLEIKPDVVGAFGTLSAFAGFVVVTLHQKGQENEAKLEESKSRKAELELRLRSEFLKVAELRLEKDKKMTSDETRETLRQIQKVWMEAEQIMHGEIKRAEAAASRPLPDAQTNR